ncbi:MAG: DUF4440 domain-containing protein, partial [Kangiella sp.]|nr:DUF4440 domain-containing protein [Kangiella sp.]
LALGTTLLFGGVAWLRYRRGENSPSNTVWLSMLVALLMLGATGWFGGELVYRHGIGVMSLPAVTGESHDHSEGEGHGDTGDIAETRIPPAQIADSLHHRLKSGDVSAVKALLAPDVLILEGDHAQRNRLEYMSDHMVSDMAFLPNIEREILDREVRQTSDLAWVITRSRMEGEFKGQVIKQETREMLVMEHDGQKWQITLIHWGEP